MTDKVTWGEHTRIYESGVDKVVLYPENAPGVPWNGVMSIETGLNVNSPDPIYIDGIKVGEVRADSPFEATLKAYTYPDEFLPYTGVDPQGNGVYLNQQYTNLKFGLCFRTLINGGEHYRLHLMYNLSATPSGTVYNTLSTTNDPATMVWKLIGTPVNVPGRRPTCHIYIESHEMHEKDLEHIEKALYGDGNLPSRQLSPVDLMGSWF